MDFGLRKLMSASNAINKVTLTLASLCFLAIVGVIVWMGYKIKDDSFTIGYSDKIDDTPTIVEQMKEIGQWEFLSISDEELVDTVRRGFFSDDELVRIYYGTMRLGIDFSQCDGWCYIDVEALEAYDGYPGAQGTALANRAVSGDYNNLRLKPGENLVSWSGSGTLSAFQVRLISRWI
jgi:hypothetical protein